MSSIEKRGGRRYVYRHRRANGRVVRSYLGPTTDPVTHALSRIDRLRTAQQTANQEAVRNELGRYAVIEPILAFIASIAASKIRHRRMLPKSEPNPQRIPLPFTREKMTESAGARATNGAVERDDFDELVERAAQGDDEALSELRRLLSRNPAIYKVLGDLSAHVQQALIGMLGDASPAVRESLQLKIADLRRQLGAENAAPLERLAADQVVTSLLDLTVQQIGAAQPHDRRSDTSRWQRQLERAHRRHLAALSALAEVQYWQRGE